MHVTLFRDHDDANLGVAKVGVYPTLEAAREAALPWLDGPSTCPPEEDGDWAYAVVSEPGARGRRVLVLDPETRTWQATEHDAFNRRLLARAWHKAA
jgi:hypothetical protein